MYESRINGQAPMLLNGAVTTLVAALVLALFWYGVAFPRHEQSHLQQMEAKAVQLARLLEGTLGPEVFSTEILDNDAVALIERARLKSGLLKVKLFDRGGRTLYSSDPAEIGVVNQHDYFRDLVALGHNYSKLVRVDENTLDQEQAVHDVVETYVPVQAQGRFVGAFELYLDATRDLQSYAVLSRAMNRDFAIVVVLLVGAIVLLMRHNYRAALVQQQARNAQLQAEVERRRQIEGRLRDNEHRFDHMAHHDPLTGLPNRRLFGDRLAHALALARREETRVALLFLDLDRFKTVNDSLGHQVGDQLLVEVCGVLQGALRQSDTIARMGGDEFTILLEEVDDDYQVSRLAERVLQLLEPPITIDDYELKTGASIGIAIGPQDGATPDELLKNADTAMYRAKDKGRGCFQYYMPELNARAEVKLLLEGSISGALAQGQFLLHFQPQVDLVSGRICGAEALVRWDHPKLGLVSPAEFIPLAEESGLIVRIGEWVLLEACRQARRWYDLGIDNYTVAVNLSSRQFRDPQLFDKVMHALEVTGLPGHCLELELTESLLMERPERTAEVLQRLYALGISIAVDDFGTGYSSLSYLRKFTVSRLKIDRSFVSDIDQPDDARIVSTIIALAHGLDLEVVAEGIEDEHQLEFLRERDCQLGQGFYFFKPLPAEIFFHKLVQALPPTAVAQAGDALLAEPARA